MPVEADTLLAPRVTMPEMILKATIAAITTKTMMMTYSSIVWPFSSRRMALQAWLTFLNTESSIHSLALGARRFPVRVALPRIGPPG